MNDKDFDRLVPKLLARAIIQLDAAHATYPGEEDADMCVPSDHWTEWLAWARHIDATGEQLPANALAKISEVTK